MTILEESPASSTLAWTAVCALADLVPDRGAAALVDGTSIALFRLAVTPDLDEPEVVLAIDDVDPRTGAAVLARGLVGSAGSSVFVASPLYKERYDLHTGACLDDASLSVRTWPVRVVDGQVQVASR